MKKRPTTFKPPQVVYVTAEVSDGIKYLLVHRDLGDLLRNAETHGELVGVYELKATQRITIDKRLDTAREVKGA